MGIVYESNRILNTNKISLNSVLIYTKDINISIDKTSLLLNTNYTSDLINLMINTENVALIYEIFIKSLSISNIANTSYSLYYKLKSKYLSGGNGDNEIIYLVFDCTNTSPIFITNKKYRSILIRQLYLSNTASRNYFMRMDGYQGTVYAYKPDTSTELYNINLSSGAENYLTVSLISTINIYAIR